MYSMQEEDILVNEQLELKERCAVSVTTPWEDILKDKCAMEAVNLFCELRTSKATDSILNFYV